MDALQIVFWGVLTFSILVVMHEGGHFLAARAFGVKVHEFMLGLPGPAIRAKLGETQYGVTAIPLGGYVRIAGMEPGADDPLLAAALGAVAQAGTMDAGELATTLGIDEGHAEELLFTLTDWFTLEPTSGDGLARRDARERYRCIMDPALGTDGETLLTAARAWTYKGLSTTKRIVVLAAGVVVNLLTAILILSVVFSIYGYVDVSLTIATVSPGTAAAKAGIQPGDTITGVGDTRVKDWGSFLQAMATYRPGETTTISYTREGFEQSKQVTLGTSEDGQRALLGVTPEVKEVDPTFLQSVWQSIIYLGLVFTAIGQFFNPDTFKQAVEGARSVVGISVEVRNAAREGALSYAAIVALLSLSLGAMNILPIPPLDGGKVLMEIVERLIGRPVPRRLSLGISAAGTLLLFALIGYLMYADVMRYIVRT